MDKLRFLSLILKTTVSASNVDFVVGNYLIFRRLKIFMKTTVFLMNTVHKLPYKVGKRTMGVKERKERDKAEMRELILQSAHKLFIDRGFDEISIRNIAEAIEYSPATIYLYFKDKNEIFFALHTEAFKKFNAYMSQLGSIADPFERLIAMGEKYIQFTLEHPQYYEIMFIMDKPMDCDENQETWEEGRKALGGVEALISACQHMGRFKEVKPDVMAFSIWSYMHGMCSLSLSKRLRCYTAEDAERIPKESFENFKQMLSKL